jgi:hypothetical protein
MKPILIVEHTSFSNIGMGAGVAIPPVTVIPPAPVAPADSVFNVYGNFIDGNNYSINGTLSAALLVDLLLTLRVFSRRALSGADYVNIVEVTFLMPAGQTNYSLNYNYRFPNYLANNLMSVSVIGLTPNPAAGTNVNASLLLL